jgi:hypothetical protein
MVGLLLLQFHRDIMGSCSKRSSGQIVLGEQRELDSDSGSPPLEAPVDSEETAELIRRGAGWLLFFWRSH